MSKIALDLDGVVVNSIPEIVKQLNFRTGTTKHDIFNYDLTKTYNCNRKILHDILRNLDYKCLPEIPNAIKYIKRLSNNHDIYFITARTNFLGNNPRDFVKKVRIICDTNIWLNSRLVKNIHYKNVFFSKDKLETIKRNRLELIVEDNPKIAVICSNNKIDVLLFDAIYNKNCLGEYIHRVENWKEICEVINEHR